MKTENQANYDLEGRNFETNEWSVSEPQSDESTSYVDQYENSEPDNDNPEEETIVNEEDAITNDQDNLDQEFLDALDEDRDEETYDDQNNLDKQNSRDKGDPNVYDDANLDVEDLYENEDTDDDLADNNLNDLEGDHLHNPDLDKEEQQIRNKDSLKVD